MSHTPCWIFHSMCLILYVSHTVCLSYCVCLSHCNYVSHYVRVSHCVRLSHCTVSTLSVNLNHQDHSISLLDQVAGSMKRNQKNWSIRRPPCSNEFTIWVARTHPTQCCREQCLWPCFGALTRHPAQLHPLQSLAVPARSHRILV